MIESCREYGVPEPVFMEIGTDFRVEFLRRNTDASATESATVNATAKPDDALAKKYPEIDLVRDNPEITTAQMAETLQCDRTTVYRHLKKLKELGIVTRIGSDKAGRWEIISPK